MPEPETYVSMPRSVIVELGDALDAAAQFLAHRDYMNAAVHCQPVRWSPVTERVEHARRLLAPIRWSSDHVQLPSRVGVVEPEWPAGESMKVRQ